MTKILQDDQLFVRVISILDHNPLKPRANPAKTLFSSAITPTSKTFNTIWTVTINKLRLAVSGLMKINKPPSPRIAIAAPMVAKISTMINPSKMPTVTSCRFCRDSEDTGADSISMGAVELSAWGRVLISAVVAVIAAVIKLSWAPT